MRAPLQEEMRSLDTLGGADTEGIAPSTYGIYPYNIWRRVWEYLMYFLSMVCLWQLPYEWFFDLERSFLYIFPALIIDAFFLIDIFVVMRTGILQYGVIKLDKATIRSTFKTWRLVIYWLSPWPYYLIGWFLKSDLTFNVLLALKCLRFLRLYDAQHVIQDTLVYISPVSRMMTLFCGFFTIAHFSACIFWYTGYYEIPHHSWLIESKIMSKPKAIQYFHTLYYILTTILTIGYGDLHPYTFPEVCVVIAIEAIGVFFYNFLVSNMVSIVADPSRNSFLSKYQRIYSAFRWRGVSPETMEELLKYYEYVWERDRDRADFYETASKMPEGLQKKLALALHMDVFTKVDALRGADEEVLERVAMALRPRIFTPGDFLIKAGRVSNRMFFITEGKIGIMNKNGAIVRSFDGMNGVVLGEASVLNGSEETASGIAETYVEAFELMKDDFDEIAAAFPQLQNQLQRRSARRFES
jgi:hyperpolarization activated cyclic nucleotide-gated potassium channel 2